MITDEQFKSEVQRAIRHGIGTRHLPPTTIYVSEGVWLDIIEELFKRPMSWQVVPCDASTYMGLGEVMVCESNYLKIH